METTYTDVTTEQRQECSTPCLGPNGMVSTLHCIHWFSPHPLLLHLGVSALHKGNTETLPLWPSELWCQLWMGGDRYPIVPSHLIKKNQIFCSSSTAHNEQCWRNRLEALFDRDLGKHISYVKLKPELQDLVVLISLKAHGFNAPVQWELAWFSGWTTS